MFMSLFRNKKRIGRNTTFSIISFLLSLTAIGLVLFFVKVTLPIWAIGLICGVGSLGVTIFCMWIIAMGLNKRDAELLRRFKTETANQDNINILEANGVKNADVHKTSRHVKEIKRDLSRLTTEYYMAVERDKNLKLGRKF